jgi:hypothetical protein
MAPSLERERDWARDVRRSPSRVSARDPLHAERPRGRHRVSRGFGTMATNHRSTHASRIDALLVRNHLRAAESFSGLDEAREPEPLRPRNSH